MDTSKEQIEAQLAAYIDGELSESERLEIERHLARHPHHQKLISELMQGRALLQGLPRANAPSELNSALVGQLERSALLDPEADRHGDAGLRIRRWPQFAAVAAVIMLALGLGIVVYYVLPPTNINSHGPLAQNDKSNLTAPVGPGAAHPGKSLAKAATAPKSLDELAAKLEKRDLSKSGAGAIALQEGTRTKAANKSLDADNGAPASRWENDKANAVAVAKGEGTVGGRAMVTAADVEQLRAQVFFREARKNIGESPALLMVVSTDNPQQADEQITKFLTTNGITYIAGEAPGWASQERSRRLADSAKKAEEQITGRDLTVRGSNASPTTPSANDTVASTPPAAAPTKTDESFGSSQNATRREIARADSEKPAANAKEAAASGPTQAGTEARRDTELAQAGTSVAAANQYKNQQNAGDSSGNRAMQRTPGPGTATVPFTGGALRGGGGGGGMPAKTAAPSDAHGTKDRASDPQILSNQANPKADQTQVQLDQQHAIQPLLTAKMTVRQATALRLLLSEQAGQRAEMREALARNSEELQKLKQTLNFDGTIAAENQRQDQLRNSPDDASYRTAGKSPETYSMAKALPDEKRSAKQAEKKQADTISGGTTVAAKPSESGEPDARSRATGTAAPARPTEPADAPTVAPATAPSAPRPMELAKSEAQSPDPGNKGSGPASPGGARQPAAKDVRDAKEKEEEAVEVVIYLDRMSSTADSYQNTAGQLHLGSIAPSTRPAALNEAAKQADKSADMKQDESKK